MQKEKVWDVYGNCILFSIDKLFLNLYTVSIVLAVYLSVKYWGCKKKEVWEVFYVIFGNRSLVM